MTTKRSLDMEKALYAASSNNIMNQSERNSRNVIRDSFMADVEVSNKQCVELRSKLLEASTREARLVQQGMSAKVAEDLLLKRIEQEQQSTLKLEEQAKELELEIEDLKAVYLNKKRSIDSNIKQLAVLDLNVKDISDSMQDVNLTERKVTNTANWAHQKSRDLERERVKTKIQNTSLAAGVKDLADSDLKLQRQSSLEQDELMRDDQQHQVQAEALKHDISEKEQVRVYLEAKRDMFHINKNGEEEAMKLKIQDMVAEKEGCQRRIQDGEEENKNLASQIMEKDKVIQFISLDLKTENDSRQLLQRQLQDKNTIALDLGQRLHAQQLKYAGVEKSLESMFSQTEIMTKKKASNSADIEVATARILKDQAAQITLGKWLEKEKTLCDNLRERATDLQEQESQCKIRMSRALACKGTDKKKLAVVAEALMKVRSEVHESEREELDALELTTSMYAKRAKEVQNQVIAMNSLDKEMNTAAEARHRQFSDYNEEIETLNDECATQDSLVSESNKELSDLSELIEEVRAKYDLEKRDKMKILSELKSTNDVLTEALDDQVNRNDSMDSDLDSARRRITSINEQKLKNDETMHKLKEINSQQSLVLQNKVEKEMLRLERTRGGHDQDEMERDAMRGTVQGELNVMHQMQKDLRLAKHEGERIQELLETRKQPDLENELIVADLEKTKEQDVKDLLNKQNDLDEAKEALNNYTSQNKILKEELLMAERKESEHFSQQVLDQKYIKELQETIANQDKRHVDDASLVRKKIEQLHEALVEKSNDVESLTKATFGMKTLLKQIQARLSQAESEAKQAQVTFEGFLQDEQALAADMRTVLEAKRRDVSSLESELLSRGDQIQSMLVLVDEKDGVFDSIAKSTFTLSKEAHTAEAEVQAINIRQEDHLRKLTQIEDETKELKLHIREQKSSNVILSKDLEKAQSQNVQLKQRVFDKTRADEVLQAIVVKSRYHIDEDSRHDLIGETETRKAEKAFEEILRNMNKNMSKK